MPSIIDQLTEIYVFIDDHLKQHPEKAQWRGSNNAEPAFSDAEVLTIGLSQSALGVQSLKEAYEKIRDNHQAAFPHLPSYKQWLARLHALNHLVSDLLIEEADMLMLTRADATDRKKLLSQIRQQVETTFSQLWLKFIDRVFSRSWLGLWNTLQPRLWPFLQKPNGCIRKPFVFSRATFQTSGFQCDVQKLRL